MGSFRKAGLLLAGLFLTSVVALAQSQVSGTVTDESDGQAIPGASIIIKGTTSGTVTDVNGNFTISASSGDVLVFSFVGYLTKEVAVGNQTTIDVALGVDVQQLQEVVVTGYATQQKKDLTGAVGLVEAEELVAMPQANVQSQLQGRVAGVQVSQDARPGAGASVRIRGISSFQNSDPLYIVDGVQTFNISTLNPQDVESISVLKDAGAAAIYGSRAANGVIVITTKAGSNEGVQVNYNMYYGTQNPGSGPDNLLNSQQFVDLQQLVYDNDGTSETHPVYGPTGNLTLPSWAADTDWYDEITRNARIQSHDVSLSGGNKNAKFYTSVNYFEQQGIQLENFYERFTARFNSDFNVKDRVTIGQNITVSQVTDRGTTGNGEEGGFMALGVYRTQPIIPVIWNNGSFTGISHQFENGDYGGTGIAPRLGNGDNFVATAQRDAQDRFRELRVLGNMFADVKIIDGLNFRTSFGGTWGFSYGTNWISSTYESAENVATDAYSENAGFGGSWNWTNTITFNKDFGSSRILAVAGYEAVKDGIGRGLGATRAGYFSSAFAFRTLDNGAQITGAGSGFGTERTLVSQFLRADYSFSDKYFLSATVRRDGSSVFGQDTRYGVFPSVSAGWRLSEESFLAGNSFITDLKIRGGYGTMGNQSAVDAANQFFTFGAQTNQTFYDLNGSGNSSLQGFRPTRIGNPDAQWETAVNVNVGFDAGLLDNKLEVVFDWYNRQNVDLLYNLRLPGTAGSAAVPFVNIAEMRNTGIDLQIIYRQNWSDFRFEANAQLTTVNNEIVKIADGVEFFDAGGSRIGPFNRNQVGQPVGSFFGYDVQGLFQSDAEVTGAPAQDGAEAGFFRYADIDGDNAITPDDRTVIGNPNPDFTYGLNLSAGYKNFDLTAFFYGSQGNEIFNYNRWWTDFWPSFQGQKSTDLLENSWTPSRTDATTPKASNTSNFSTNTVANSYYIENGSYFRLKQLQIGYTLPKTVMGNVFSNARIYLQGVNLFTITSYTGLDPELATAFNQDTRQGVDEGNYPAVQQYLIGVNLGF